MSPKAAPRGVDTQITSVRLPHKLVVVVDRAAKKDKVSRNAKIQEILERHFDTKAPTHRV